ncbi:MAG: IS200/IS605 family transposase [Bacteroidales bacterium]|nr:IS200/IS605 family transposase [Bacteroidales bacterium]
MNKQSSCQGRNKTNVMANTYTQIHIQAVFEVRDRKSIILNFWKDELYKYITGIVQNNNHKLLAINGMPDQIHMLFGFRPTQSLSDLMQDIKGNSSKWINDKGFIRGKFSWQEGYAAFSYAKSDLENIIRYIQNQKEHHTIKTFIKEYLDLLKEFDIEYDDRFVFKPVDIDYHVPNGTY